MSDTAWGTTQLMSYSPPAPLIRPSSDSEMLATTVRLVLGSFTWCSFAPVDRSPDDGQTAQPDVSHRGLAILLDQRGGSGAATMCSVATDIGGDVACRSLTR
jgi:hypothetical protein